MSDSSGESPGDHPTRSSVTLSRRGLAVLVVLLVAPWAAFLWMSRSQPARHEGSAAAPAVQAAAPGNGTESSRPANGVRPGPWGDLIVTRIEIEPPESLLPPPGAARKPSVWTFPGRSSADLLAWWRTLGLDAAQSAELADPARWEILPDAIRIRPSDELVLGLSPELRTRIYSVLSEHLDNPEQNDPFRFRADAADEWFAHSNLRPETIALVKPLLYRRGSSLLFSDLSLILPRLPSQLERTQLIKTLARKSTLMVKLRISADSDIDALDRYWSRGQRGRDVKPLLQSLVRRDGTTTIDIIHLLPRLPRSLLYTYPLPTEKGRGSFLDCHWTTLNFFNVQPDPRFEDVENVTATFNQDHYPLSGRPTFGDVVILTKRDNSVMHSCIYVADNIVYTKNGSSPNAPWILMDLSDVIAFYPTDEPLDVQYYRSKKVAVEE